ncbi:ABC multidrug transporter atrF [Penicillium atrosanguineum]|nr:ABC multidrug transporter atrF [Penicillium atrosanguineum]
MITEYDYPNTEEARERTQDFKDGVKACVSRQYQIIWGDKATFIIKQVATLMQALIAGSLFYSAPDNSGGLFVKSGALFFSLLYNSLLAMSEVTDSFHELCLLPPAAFCLAQIAADIPVLLFQISMFSLVVYFMVGLTMSAGAFFTYWILVFTTTMCMTALFRAIGALFSTFDGASKVSGFLISALIMYTGYMIQKPEMHPWLGWIFWIDPLAYGFEALLSNEFNGKTIPCVGTNLIPSGAGYDDPAHQSCAGVGGAIQGNTYVTGEQYLASLSYSHSHLWRNFGINWAWWVLFVVVTIIATSRWRSPGESGSCLVIPVAKPDEESQVQEKSKSPSDSGVVDENNIDQQLVRNTSVFTWKDLKYTVKTPSGDRVLLDNVFGWVKPGMLGALMGSSGAGKTTLLDVLAQRKTDGVINGSILVDGRELPVSFQRSAGYCEQLDVLEPFATVRESLEFSALLRQARDVPREEKLKYVDTIIDLLELHDLADTLIGYVGAGLSVEQRKRVTIGVELVSKPSILIFLDEPTSGLDGQSAYNTVRFLRKLADIGQAVLVTIHQPSAQLFAEFDTLLLLTKGGKTVYFGDIGDNGQTVKGYFERYGAPCPSNTNPAEHMIDVVSGHLSQGKDWNQVWLESPEHSHAVKELDEIVSTAASKPPGTFDDGHEFATSIVEQTKLVTLRMSTALFRNTDYVNNKFALHIGSALFNGFSFWMIGDSVSAMQLRLFTIFNFIFVAPGVINQLQPLFLERRAIYEQREKKSKMYSWWAFVTALVVSEIPYLCICAVLYFVCWYWTIGGVTAADKSGPVFFMMLLYEFVYTVSFCGVLVPYAQIQEFWRYWIYWLNPFNYLMGGLLVFNIWDTDVNCKEKEYAIFNPANGTACGDYLKSYMETTGSRMNLVNPPRDRVLQGLREYYYGWRDIGIVAIFALSSYALVYLLMKLRTKASKKAE